VTILKYIDGSQATAQTASSSDFQFNATWNASSTGSGSGGFTLSATSSPAYQASTTELTNGGSYSFNEVLGGNTTASCATSTASSTKAFSLAGYSIGNTLAAAASATPSLSSPSFTNLMEDKYVIVWNNSCTSNATTTDSLHVTSVDVIQGTAVADGSFEGGWKYLFHITAPSSEADLAMKFSNWVSSSSSSTIPVAGNMRISSSQSNNASSTVTLNAANTYSTNLHMTGDLSTTTAGRQVDVLVEVAIPQGSENGTYSTTYGIRTQ
jgi:hypothetical protein